MKACSAADLAAYLADDWVLREIQAHPEDAQFISQRWLRKLPPKRMMFADLYGDLLHTEGKRILDIGGGFSSFSRTLVERHDYTLVDPMLDESTEHREEIKRVLGARWVTSDWRNFPSEGTYDLVIANDVFPNVDRGLEEFLHTVASRSEVRLTLTCYDRERALARLFEMAVRKAYPYFRRVNADAVAFTHAPTTRETAHMLAHALGDHAPTLEPGPSLFENGRIVYKLILA
jgi:trans-aconitate methyltransferase